MKTYSIVLAICFIFFANNAAVSQSIDFPPDPTNSVSSEGIYLPPNATNLNGSLEGIRAPASDPRVAEWSAMRLANDAEALLQAVEKDLLSNSPHPWASYVWVHTQWSLGALTANKEPSYPAKIADILSFEARAFRFETLDREDLLANMVDEALAREARVYWAEYNIAYSACRMFQNAKCRALFRRLVEAFPDDFGAVFALTSWSAGEPVETLAWIKGTPSITNSPAARFIEWHLASPDAGYNQILIATNIWLKHAPDDPNAIRRAAYQLENLNRYDAALALFEKEEVVFPFSNAAARVGGLQATLRQFEAAKDTAEQWAQRSQPDASRASHAAIAELQMLQVAGEYGYARTAGLKALEAFPRNDLLRVVFAKTLRQEGFGHECIEILNPVLKHDPTYHAAASEMIRALLAAKRYEDAVNFAANYKASGGKANSYVFNGWRQALHNLGRFDQLLEVEQAARMQLPDVAWVFGNFAHSYSTDGNTEKAYELIRETLLADVGSAWPASKLVEFGRKAGRVADAEATLVSLVARYPYEPTLWEHLGKLRGLESETWTEAAQKSPTRGFGYSKGANKRFQQTGSNWELIRSNLKNDIAQMRALHAPDEEIAVLYGERTGMLDDAFANKFTDDVSLISPALRELDKARALGLAENEYWKSRLYLIGRAGPSRERAIAGIRNAQLHPDNVSDQSQLFVDDIRRFMNNATPMLYRWRYTNRRPRNSERLIGFAHRQAKWGGSAVVSLAALAQAKRWNPDANVDQDTEFAYSSLGAHQRYYDSHYNQATGISRSQRYVGWFENSRQNAAKSQAMLKNLDLESMSVTTLSPEGIEQMGRYHPVTGMLIAFRIGAFEGTIDYTEEGEWKGMTIGGSKLVELQFSPLSPDGLGRKLLAIRQPNHETILFEYDEKGRIAETTVGEMGTVKVPQDADGNNMDPVVKVLDPTVSNFDVSSALNNGINSLRQLQLQMEKIQQGKLNDFELKDPTLTTLREQYEYSDVLDHKSYVEWAKNGFVFAKYLSENMKDHPLHAQTAAEVLQSIYENTHDVASLGESSEQTAIQRTNLVEAVRLWRQLMLKSRPDGLPASLWERWKLMRDHVATIETKAPQVIAAIAKFQDELQKKSLRSLSNKGWLESSHLKNPGFWRTHARHQIIPKALINHGLRFRDVLVRKNGDVVVATNRGLSVLRRGYWEWFAHDKVKGRLSANVDYANVEGSSNFTSLVEDGNARLWVGSRAGVMILANDYAGDLTFLRSGTAGLFQGAVEALAAHGEEIAAGGDAGLALITTDQMVPRIVSKEPVERLRETLDGVIAIGRNKLWLQHNQDEKMLVDSRVTDAIIGPDGKTLYILMGKLLQQVNWREIKEGTATPRGVSGSETIIATADPFGLALLEFEADKRRLTVLTDMGGSVLGEGGFEHFKQPVINRPVGLLDVHEYANRLFMLTTEGVASVVRGEANYALQDRVYDLLSDPVLETTFIATGSSIQTIDQKNPSAGVQHFSGVNARILTQSPSGALITHDGPTILQFDQGTHSATELFDTTQSLDHNYIQGIVTSILAASDGSIWVTAGASVFHWRGDETLREYTMFSDPKSAPFNSDMLFNVQEAPDGRILITASDEGHRSYKGKSLDGGLFEFSGNGFIKSKLDVLGDWFLTSSTRVSEKTAIVGTSDGLARLHNNKLEEFDRLEESSYMALKKQLPALYLGTRGARVGENLWLFGTAGGVVALRDKTWFYPDRLNWMLPDQQDANYGARTVHAVSTDSYGRVYVGTDRGLTIYDPNGAGATSFLVSEQRGDFAFSALEQNKMREVNDILTEALPQTSDAGKLAVSFRKKRKELVALETKLKRAIDNGKPARKLKKKVQRAQQRDIAILAKLEREHPLVFSMLQLNPLDLRALARKLPDNIVIAQYLPTKTALYINLVNNNGAELKEVSVSGKQLDLVTQRVTKRIANVAMGKRRFFDVDGGKKSTTDTQGKPNSPIKVIEGTDEITSDLAWLYDHLLRPIEHAVPDDSTLVISQTGSLTYLPFSALVREVGADRPKYAIERFNLAAAPSLYALDMIINAAPSTAYSHVVFGDPDGSLSNARAEAQSIAKILSDDLVELRVGEAATYDELLSHSGDARFVHLAMHGKLDHLSPKDSYLLLADRRRMSIPQIMTLPMSETELVFLSACESGLGSDGLEYRTIAHAFAHAGAPAVVATLWQIDDKAARLLAESFYQAKIEDASNAEALGQAQRKMINSGGARAHPGFWAAAVIFGKP